MWLRINAIRHFRQNEIQKIYRFAITPNDPRGDEIDITQAALEAQYLTEYRIAQWLQKMMLQTLIFFKSNEDNKTKLRLILIATRLGI